MLDISKLIIIDFEGFIGKPPSLVGVYHHDLGFKTIIHDESLVGTTIFEGTEFLDIESFIQSMSNFCRENKYTIIGYSQRELQVFQDFGFDISEIYFNARKELKKWYNRIGRLKPEPFSLDSVIKDLGYPNYQNFGKQQTTQRINHVRNQLILRNQDFQALTPTAKSKWTKVIKYNMQDVISVFWALETANSIK